MDPLENRRVRLGVTNINRRRETLLGIRKTTRNMFRLNNARRRMRLKAWC